MVDRIRSLDNATGHKAQSSESPVKPVEQPAKPAKRPRLNGEGFIEPHTLYTVNELRRRLGLQQHVWRGLRRKVRIIEFGRKQFVLGQDFIDAITASDAAAKEHHNLN